MNFNNLKIWSFVLIIIGLGVVGVVWHNTYYSSEELSVAQQTVEPAGPQSPPARLVIPSLGVDAVVQKVGIAKSGNMAVPDNFTDVGWYRNGPKPGEVGSAVIDGHVDNALGLDGVFKHISELKIGDSIISIGEDGSKKEFIVQQIASYPVEDVPLQILFNRADEARLNLITCDGVWIQDKKNYDKRLVVFAELKN